MTQKTDKQKVKELCSCREHTSDRLLVEVSSKCPIHGAREQVHDFIACCCEDCFGSKDALCAVCHRNQRAHDAARRLAGKEKE